MSNVYGNELKRPCSSLSIDNTCTACSASFGTPHLLSKHQKSCTLTSENLRRLRAQVAELDRAKKRRRTDEVPQGSTHISPGSDSAEGRSADKNAEENDVASHQVSAQAPMLNPPVYLVARFDVVLPILMHFLDDVGTHRRSRKSACHGDTTGHPFSRKAFEPCCERYRCRRSAELR